MRSLIIFCAGARPLRNTSDEMATMRCRSRWNCLNSCGREYSSKIHDENDDEFVSSNLEKGSTLACTYAYRSLELSRDSLQFGQDQVSTLQ